MSYRAIIHSLSNGVTFVAIALIALLVLRLIFPPNQFRYGTGSIWYRLGRATDWLVQPVFSALPPGTSPAAAVVLAIVAVLVMAYFGLGLIVETLSTLAGFRAALGQGALIPAVGYLLYGAVSLYITALILRILFSWIRIGYYSGGRSTRFVYDVTEPALALFRGIIPPLGMFDLSPIILFFLLQIVKRAIVTLLIGG